MPDKPIQFEIYSSLFSSKGTPLFLARLSERDFNPYKLLNKKTLKIEIPNCNVRPNECPECYFNSYRNAKSILMKYIRENRITNYRILDDLKDPVNKAF